MYLEKLEIQGFKSFARPTTFIFNRELTAIVGPNGSGKSNIADAVRWVLGEQSVKTLRGKKSEDVIFAGSDTKGRLGFARVDLFLNNQGSIGTDVNASGLDYEQVILSRSIDRKGDSEYLINNNKVRLLDIQLLLAQANFGQKTYSVIGQGMIDSILTASAAERKEFFDEATGVRQFQIKKDQAIHKLDRSKDNLAQTGQILLELEPRLRSLTRQVKKIEKRGQLETELVELQTQYYSFLTNNLDTDLQQVNSEFNKKQKEVSDLNQQLVSLQTRLDEHEQTDSRQDKFQTLQAKLTQSQSELNILLKEKTILEGKVDLKLMSGGKVDLVWIKNRQHQLQDAIVKNKLAQIEHQKGLDGKKKIVAELKIKQQEILTQFKSLEENLQDNKDVSQEYLSSELQSIVEQQDKLEINLASLDSLDNIEQLKHDFQTLAQATKKLWSKIKENPADPSTRAQDGKVNWQIEFNKLLSTKDNLVAEINEAQTKVVVLQHKLEQVQQQLDHDQGELEKLATELKVLSGQNVDSAEFAKQLEQLEKKLKLAQEETEKTKKDIQDFNIQEEAAKSSLVADQKRFRELQQDFNSKSNGLNEIKVRLARLETRKEDLDKEITEEFPSFELKETGEVDTEITRQRIHSLKNQLGSIGAIDASIVEEHKEVDERYQFLDHQSKDLNEAIAHLEKVIKDLDESISNQFDQSFKSINQLFGKYFKQLFSGGKAQLILDIKEVPLDNPSTVAQDDLAVKSEEDIKTKKQYGIEIMATPPGKKLSGINMLSGGEKAMTSIALICAIIANNPAPFVVLDEVDAALDEANSVRLAEILGELSDKTQFIAITHNRATMHQAKIIYGITMGDDGISNLLSMNFDQADEIAA
ncbi:AAA family ATPase [bacterium]|jgi:chromosome segregation protein|nr:AAA family ATPase [bacterium]MBT4649221.1 AAA family ATPase [bacterium]